PAASHLGVMCTAALARKHTNRAGEIVVEFFVKIPGIAGTSADRHHPNWIELTDLILNPPRPKESVGVGIVMREGQTSLQIIRLVTERVSIDPVLLDLTSEGDLYLRSRLEHVTVDSYSRFPQGSKQMSTGVVTGPFVQFNLFYEKAVPINGTGYK